MTYNEFIQQIIATRGQWNYLYKEEVHHIIPVCLGGTGKYKKEDPNTIFLTLQEHYEAHRLLAEENPENTSLQRAWFMMSNKNGVFISADEYAKSKKAFIKSISGDNSPNKRPEVRQHLVEGAKKRDKSTYKTGNQRGKNNGNYGKHTLAGKNHFYWGKKRDSEQMKKVSKTRIERGVAKGAKNPRARAVICVETGVEYETGVSACNWLHTLEEYSSYTFSGLKSGVCTSCKTGKPFKKFTFTYK